MESALKSLANYWRKQAKHWQSQEKAWHEVALFCRQAKEELAKKREELKRAAIGR